uniref:Tetratricopeptide repeat domain 5 n=1 Tax=Nannospalax galili TaxID=1026970 RepID=A0A8C6RZE9_NANGA
TMADEEEEAQRGLQKLQELVDQLYSFRDCYFETHSVKDAGRKRQDVQDEMEKTLQQMEEVLDILGNAYLSLYFNTGQNPKISQQALGAYAQAEKVDRKASSNPDLHLNRATLHKYEENFGEALEGFSQAAALDPAWPEPRQREQQLVEFLNRLTSLLESKGKMKAKKLQSMLGSLRPVHLGPCGDGRYQSASGQKVNLELKPLSTLQPGVNSGTVVLGKVVFSLTTEEKVPFTFGLVDSDGPCYAVMVYNMVQSWGVLIGDSVAIPEPNLRLHQIQHKGK